MIKIKRQIVPDNIIKTRTHGTGNKMEYIAIHETANTNVGANADAHSRLQINGNKREASWHYQVDDKEIIQSFEDNIKCWHVGNYNDRAIAIEICVNKDGDFKKAVENAVALTKHLMAKHNIPIDKVKQHNYFTGKDCPTNLRNGSKGITWNDFINMVKGSKSTPAQPSKHKTSKPTNKTISQMADEVIAGKHGNGHANRQKSLGISNEEYELVKAEVNKRLSSTSKPKPTPAKPKPTPKPKSISQMAQEIIDGKHGNGHENRRKSLGISKEEYAKVRAEVNRRLTGKSKASSKSKLKPIDEIAKEVIAGKWGNGAERKRRLSDAGYNPTIVQKEVNRQLRRN